ncbi:hypothetical protein [uncultured Reyranella sp.]|jgi:hypothetical protein|uniref:hypothetical protein n=1 Tax=uncultured Reyranella sp. TaxID=735512 RepID=UPI00259C9451|nr:hypothetical protein [uncultured Reyranella sp.]
MAKAVETLFLKRATYQAVDPVTYEEGSIHSLRPDLAERWVRRGVATTERDAIAAAKAAKEPKPATLIPTTPSV